MSTLKKNRALQNLITLVTLGNMTNNLITLLSGYFNSIRGYDR